MPRAPERLRKSVRVQVDDSVDPVTRALAGAWARTYVQLRGELVAAAEEAALAGPLSPADFRAGRLGAAMNLASAALRQLGTQSGVTIQGALYDTVAGSAEVHASFLVASSRAHNAGVSVNLLRPETLGAIVARATERIASATPQLTMGAEMALRDQLIRGVAAGQGPKDVARRMVEQVRGVFGGGMTRAINLARTEMVDAHRAGALAVRQANAEYVTGWTWQARLNDRTCPACWAMHGTVHPADEVMRGHQSCRCTPVPRLVWDDETDALPSADEAFRKLPRAQQLRIMGPGRLAALEDGRVQLGQLARVRANPGWREGFYPVRVRDLPPPGGKPLPEPPQLPPTPDPYLGMLTDERQVYDMLSDAGDKLPGDETDYATQLGALSWYTGSGYRTLNKLRRDGAKAGRTFAAEVRRAVKDSYILPETAKSLTDMDNGLHAAIQAVQPLPAAAQVWRGSKHLPNGWDDGSDMVGKVFTDDAWSSTSSKEGSSQAFVGGGDESIIMTVELPKGARVLPVDSAMYGRKRDSFFGTGEYEFILPPGTRFLVTEVGTRKVHGTREIRWARVRVVPDE